jgi:FMN phosphatase YigB (HAD superfamily)
MDGRRDVVLDDYRRAGGGSAGRRDYQAVQEIIEINPMKKLIVFDLDSTLAESKASLDTEMSALLHDKFVLQTGEEECAPLNFPCWQYEPLKSILLNEDLEKYKERTQNSERSRQKNPNPPEADKS